MDTAAVLDLMKDVAAQVITPRFRALAGGEIMEKRPGDLVTVADREAEELLTAALRADDPAVLVVGEEATSADRSLLDRLAAADHAFTVDPIDGTKNFVHGRPTFAVMIAELRAGETVRAWIWQPVVETAYVAERGGGAWENDRRLGPAWGGPTDPAVLRPEALRVLTSRPSDEGAHHGLELGPTAWSCGVDYPWLATGKAAGVLYSNTYPWDHAPGALLVEETGGVVRRPDGTRFVPGVYRRTGLIVATHPAVADVVAPLVVDLFR